MWLLKHGLDFKAVAASTWGSWHPLLMEFSDTLIPFLYLLIFGGGGIVILWFSSGFSYIFMQSWTFKTVYVCVCVCTRAFVCLCICVCVWVGVCMGGWFQHTEGLWSISPHVYLNEDQALEYKHSFNAQDDCYTGFLLLALLHLLHHREEFNSKGVCSFSSFLTISPFFAVARRYNHVPPKAILWVKCWKMLPPPRQHEGIMCSRNSSPDAGPHKKERCSVMKNSFMMSQECLQNEIHAGTVAAVRDSSWRLQHDSCSQQRGKYFHTSQSSSLSSHAHRRPASLLCLRLSSCWLFRRNDMMAKSSLPFPGLLGAASRSNKSFLFISGSILTGCRWEAKMSTSVLTAAGACGTLSFFFFFPPFFSPAFSAPILRLMWCDRNMQWM